MTDRPETAARTLGEISERYGSLLKLVDELNCGLLVTDGEGHTLYVNRRLAQWMRADPEALLGDNRGWTLPEQEREVEAERDLILAGDMRARLLALRRSDGTTFPVLALPHLLGAEGGAIGLAFLMIELSTVQTARRIGEVDDVDPVLSTLRTMAMQLHQLVNIAPTMAPPVDLRHPDLREISPRELEVLDLLLQGERVAAIAEQLYISDHTVRNHLKSMFRKTGTSSQGDLVRWVRELG